MLDGGRIGELFLQLRGAGVVAVAGDHAVADGRLHVGDEGVVALDDDGTAGGFDQLLGVASDHRILLPRPRCLIHDR